MPFSPDAVTTILFSEYSRCEHYFQFSSTSKTSSAQYILPLYYLKGTLPNGSQWTPWSSLYDRRLKLPSKCYWIILQMQDCAHYTRYVFRLKQFLYGTQIYKIITIIRGRIFHEEQILLLIIILNYSGILSDITFKQL